jgi:hypothetical protein
MSGGTRDEGMYVLVLGLVHGNLELYGAWYCTGIAAGIRNWSRGRYEHYLIVDRSVVDTAGSPMHFSIRGSSVTH